MRALLIAALVADCHSSSPPTRVVFVDSLMEAEAGVALLDRLETEVSPFPGCRLRRAEGDVAINCPSSRDAARFDCRDHPAGHPLYLTLAGTSMSLHCE